MSKRDKPKLGRSFDSIIEDDNDISHKNIFQKFVASDSPDNKGTVEQNEPTKEKPEKQEPQRATERRACSGFIWYKSEENNGCSGLGRACEIWEEGIIIETTRSLSPNSIIIIETTPPLEIRSQMVKIVNSTQKEEGIYLIELNYNF